MTTPSAAKSIERAVARLRLKLMAAQSAHDEASLRDEIFMEEQTRWVTPGASVLQANSRETVALEQLQNSLPSSAVLLEYVMADSNSYCLAISRSGSRIVHLGSRARIDALVGSYLKTVKAKLPAIHEARSLYEALVRPIAETTQKGALIIVPDGQLHLRTDLFL